jgi:hypothetical protein
MGDGGPKIWNKFLHTGIPAYEKVGVGLFKKLTKAQDLNTNSTN